MTQLTPLQATLLLPYQKRIIESPARFTWNNWSRQSGKSFTFALRRILRGMARKRNQFFLSAGERQSRELIDKARRHLEVMDLAFGYDEQEMASPFDGTKFKQLEIALPKTAGGIRILGLPANPHTARGFTGDVFLDEYGMHQDDREIWGAMFPSILRGDGELDVASTPKGMNNMFYRLRENAEFAHSTVTIDDAIAQGLDVDREVLRRAMNDDEMFRQEFLCQFIDEAVAFLTYEQIGKCSEADLPRDLNIDGLVSLQDEVVVGIDIGRKRDLTVIWPFAVRDRVMVSLGLLELPTTDFETQFELFSKVISNRCVKRACMDATGLGMAPVERVVDRFGSYRVEPVNFTPLTKANMASSLRMRVQDRSIRFPMCDKVANDLHSVRKSVTSAGNIRLESPREDGSHADRFWAAALACHAAGEDKGPIEWRAGAPLVSAGLRGF